MSNIKLFYLLTLSIVFISSCTDKNTIIREVKTIPNKAWLTKEKQFIPFEIEDADATYSIYYTFSYNDTYPFYNIWVNRSIADSTKKVFSKKLQGMELFHSQSGIPFGSGFGDTYDYKILSDSLYRFSQPGNYFIILDQSMRIDSLPGIESVGIEIYKNE
jgi:gliding motility-associated lipoprotein GldH